MDVDDIRRYTALQRLEQSRQDESHEQEEKIVRYIYICIICLFLYAYMCFFIDMCFLSNIEKAACCVLLSLELLMAGGKHLVKIVFPLIA